MKKLIFSILCLVLMNGVTLGQIRTDNIDQKTKSKIENDQAERLGSEYRTDGFVHNEEYIELHSSDRNGGEVISYYTPEGSWLESVKYIDFSTLPKVVQEAFSQSTFANDNIDEVFMVDIPNNQFFAINVIGEADDRFLFISPQGKEIDLEKKLMFITRVDDSKFE